MGVRESFSEEGTFKQGHKVRDESMWPSEAPAREEGNVSRKSVSKIPGTWEQQ